MEVERALGTLVATHKVPRNPGLPREEIGRGPPGTPVPEGEANWSFSIVVKVKLDAGKDPECVLVLPGLGTDPVFSES